MRNLLFSFLVVATALCCHAGVALEEVGEAPTLHVDGRPMLILGGELGNSSASSEADIARHMAKVARMNLNTVLVPVSWELIEPEEGRFDFTLPDAVLREARKNGLKVIVLWFGAWKNSMSCYAPAWVKEDYERFPRARTSAGRPLEILSAFSENVFQADSTAFTSLLSHLSRADHDNTVLMVQVENEIGMLEDARDHSAAADSAFMAGVPAALSGTERPWSWDAMFGGPSRQADECFMAWHYGRYVGRLAGAARKVYDRPLYVNAALNSRGRLPGEYPSAGPLAHLKDIWKTAAPDVAILSPDIYDSGFTGWAASYAMPDNPLFIPEIRRCDDNPAQAIYVFGEHAAVGLCPFAIEHGSDSADSRSVRGFSALRQWEDLLLELRRNAECRGVYFDMDSVSTTIILPEDDVRLTASHFFTLPWDPRATDGSQWPAGAAVIARVGPMDYIIAGTGVVVKFEALGENGDTRRLGEDGFLADGADRSGQSGDATADRIGILKCDEVDGQMRYVRRLSGDETHQGRHVRISPDDFTILHVTLYRYH